MEAFSGSNLFCFGIIVKTNCKFSVLTSIPDGGPVISRWQEKDDLYCPPADIKIIGDYCSVIYNSIDPESGYSLFLESIIIVTGPLFNNSTSI